MGGYGLGWRAPDTVRGIPLWWSADTSYWFRYDKSSWRITAGPIFTHAFNALRQSLELEGAVRVTYIERPSFGDEDLGSHFHFASHAGLAWRVPRSRMAVGFRFEHVSNAGLWEHNPGVNFASFELRIPLSAFGVVSR
ncbi:MAG: acyloxyacyl hydrolase [Hydrocarboniphaga effusa]|nr:acyloxyacyl hydrolase [Hydrocarboniphaga effusa]